MKPEYHFQVSLKRLAIKRDPPTSTLKLSLASGRTFPVIRYEQTHTLTIRHLQKALDLSQLSSFHFKIDKAIADQQAYGLILQTHKGSQEPIDSLILQTPFIIQTYHNLGRTVFEEHYQGVNVNINYTITLSIPPSQAQPPPQLTQELTEEIEHDDLLNHNQGNSKEDQPDIKQSSRSKRPPSLSIRKKSQLLDSQKINEENNQPLLTVQDKVNNKQKSNQYAELDSAASFSANKFIVNIIEEKGKRYWQDPGSAIPQSLSAWLKKKTRKYPEQKQQMSQEVKELLQSHHPEDHHDSDLSRLSLKLKVVIGLLIFGVLVLLFDVIKDPNIQKIFEMPKPQQLHSVKKKANKKHKKPLEEEVYEEVQEEAKQEAIKEEKRVRKEKKVKEKTKGGSQRKKEVKGRLKINKKSKQGKDGSA